MKYGLIVYFNTDNIGDDIQSCAMANFLPHVDYLIDREHLDSFYTPTGERVAAILGGWYIHLPLNWPPSPYLHLLPLSFHLTAGGKRSITLTDYGLEWLKKFTMVGCRDEGTVRLLESKGIVAYLSGCFTLTFKPFPNVDHHGKIVLIDLPEEMVDFVRKHTKKETVLVSHASKKISELPPEVKKFVAEHTEKGAVATSHIPNIPCPPNWNSRRALVEGLLRFYQGASLVVTTRLHATLPTLAVGTPVLLVSDNIQSNYRFSTFLPYVNNTTAEDLFSGKYAFNFDDPNSNPGGHEKFAERIRLACADFVASCESAPVAPPIDFETWLDGQKRATRFKQLIRNLAVNATNNKPINASLYKF